MWVTCDQTSTMSVFLFPVRIICNSILQVALKMIAGNVHLESIAVALYRRPAPAPPSTLPILVLRCDNNCPPMSLIRHNITLAVSSLLFYIIVLRQTADDLISWVDLSDLKSFFFVFVWWSAVTDFLMGFTFNVESKGKNTDIEYKQDTIWTLSEPKQAVILTAT